MRTIILIFFLFFSVNSIQAQILEDYSMSWNEESGDSWFSPNTQYSIDLDLIHFSTANYTFDVPGPTIVFANETVWFYTEQDTSFMMPISDLKTLFPGDTLHILLSGPRLPISELDIMKVVAAKAPQFEGENIGFSHRRDLHQTEIKNFFFVALLFLLLITGIYRLIYPFLFASMTKPISLVNAEDFSETSNLQKFFSFDILFYLLIINLAIGLIGIIGLVLFKQTLVAEKLGFEFLSLSLGWLILSGALYLLTLVKYIGIRLVSYMFDLGKMAFPHFFYLLRLLVIGSGLTLWIISFFIANDFLAASSALRYIMFGLFSAYILGILLLFMMMMNRFSFKKYHLFTYLCISELVPFLIISKIIMNFGP